MLLFKESHYVPLKMIYNAVESDEVIVAMNQTRVLLPDIKERIELMITNATKKTIYLVDD